MVLLATIADAEKWGFGKLSKFDGVPATSRSDRMHCFTAIFLVLGVPLSLSN